MAQMAVMAREYVGQSMIYSVPVMKYLVGYKNESEGNNRRWEIILNTIAKVWAENETRLGASMKFCTFPPDEWMETGSRQRYCPWCIRQSASISDGIYKTLPSGEEMSFRNVAGRVIQGTLLFWYSRDPYEYMSVLISVEPGSSNANKIVLRMYGGPNNLRDS